MTASFGHHPGAYANEMFQMEAKLFAKFRMYPTSQSGESHTTGPGMGSIFALGIIAFGRRTSASSVTVMFRREPAVSTERAQQLTLSLPDQIRALGELRDAGLVTPEEFEAKKRELLARM